MNYDWDSKKAETNLKKHGVSFQEAVTVFDDNDALLIYDPDHSQEEDRFILLGLSSTLRILIVCHCYKVDEDTIRIFSARKATKNETLEYIRRK